MVETPPAEALEHCSDVVQGHMKGTQDTQSWLNLCDREDSYGVKVTFLHDDDGGDDDHSDGTKLTSSTFDFCVSVYGTTDTTDINTL